MTSTCSLSDLEPLTKGFAPNFGRCDAGLNDLVFEVFGEDGRTLKVTLTQDLHAQRPWLDFPLFCTLSIIRPPDILHSFCTFVHLHLSIVQSLKPCWLLESFSCS